MEVSEERWRHLLERLAAALGHEAATTMSELLPPHDVRIVARLDQLDAELRGVNDRLDGVETRLDGVETRLDGVETRLDGVETRLEGVEIRLEGVEIRLGGVETRLGGRFDEFDLKLDSLRNELVGVFRGEILAAVAGQTRAVVLGALTASVSIFGVSLGLPQLL